MEESLYEIIKNLSGAAARTGSGKRKGRKILYIKEVRRFT